MAAASDTVGFDTSRPGIPEMFWTRWAEDLPHWDPPGTPLLVVAPHPDDETLGAGGLIHTWSARGLPVTVLSLTDGEAACPEVPDLAVIRRGELGCALRELSGGRADIVRLHLPDGGLEGCEAMLVNVMSEHLRAGTVLAAPFEFDGHPDHDAAGRASRLAARHCGAHLAQFPIWAWHREALDLWLQPAPTRLELSAGAQAAKQRAMHQFRSQLAERPGGAVVPSHVLEYFSRPYEVFLL